MVQESAGPAQNHTVMPATFSQAQQVTGQPRPKKMGEAPSPGGRRGLKHRVGGCRCIFVGSLPPALHFTPLIHWTSPPLPVQCCPVSYTGLSQSSRLFPWR